MQQQEFIQFQEELPDTYSLIYKNQQYPINFDLFKLSSDYFLRHQHEIEETKCIRIFEEKSEEITPDISPDTIQLFINYLQRQKVVINNENVAQLNYLGKKFEIKQLINSTDNYIKIHLNEVCVKVLIIYQNDQNAQTQLYENVISSNLPIYIKFSEMLDLNVTVLYRILDNFRNKNESESIINENELNTFLFKALDKYGTDASSLFIFADFGEMRNQYLNRLMREYDNVFDFSYINTTFVKALYDMQNEFFNELEEIKKKQKEQEEINEEMKKRTNSQRFKREMTKLREDMNKTQEEQTQKYNEEIKKLTNEIEKLVKENNELKALQKSAEEKMKYEEEMHKKEVEELKNNLEATNNMNDMIFNNLDGEAQYSILKEKKLMKKDSENDQLFNLLGYLRKEKDRSSKKNKISNFVFIERNKKEENNKNNEVSNISALSNINDDENCIIQEEGEEAEISNISVCERRTNDKIFVSWNMIEILFENGSLNSEELRLHLDKFADIYFEVRYPSSQFDSIYKTVVDLKNSGSQHVNIAIFITGIEATDQRFHGNKDVKFIRLDSAVTEIKSEGDNGSFEGCSALTRIEIPSSVKLIGESSFYGCSSLETVDIPESVNSIGDSAFSGCSSLKSVELPSSITSIAESTFYQCSSLMNVAIPSSVKRIDNCAFFRCESMLEITIPASVEIIGDNAFFGCSSLRKIEIPKSVKSIGESLFSECSALKQVSIPSSLKLENLGIDSKVKVKKI